VASFTPSVYGQHQTPGMQDTDLAAHRGDPVVKL
jgi:hypothetical protein